MGASAGALPSLLLGILLTSILGSLGANPGLVARITDKGLEYVAREGVATLQSKLHEVTLPDFNGDFKIKYMGRGHYEFHSLDIHSCELLGSTLTPLPGQGLYLAISDSSIRVKGKWKVRKGILKLDGSFDVKVKGITISVNLLLGSGSSGRPTVAVSSCSSHINDVETHMSGDLSWLLNLFHNQIESRFRRTLESKICEEIQDLVASDLQPYLQTVPANDLAQIDPTLGWTLKNSSGPYFSLQGEIFSLDHRSPVGFLAPVMRIPEEHSRMVYFAVSDYVFKTASLVYNEAGFLNFSITDDLVPPTSNIRLTTNSFRTFVPRLARLYPNMNLELRGAMVSAPFLNFGSGNLSSTPQIEVEGFVLLPNSVREPVFRLGMATNVSATLTFNTSKITGFLKPGKFVWDMWLRGTSPILHQVELLEALLNYYLLNNLYPKVNDKLAEGFPLPLLNYIQLHDPVLQIHKLTSSKSQLLKRVMDSGVIRNIETGTN
uniref:Lipopolysaccharide-binding protein n=1 Tax=Sus scrofa TaxID=9823 RepID=A0A8D1WF27_PIG